MAKAVEAFRTISEVASDLDVPKHVLRFWEQKFPQIRPMKRGGGRRYYRPEDMELLRGIRRLLHAEGYTIKGVQKILREHGVDHVKASAAADLPVEKSKSRTRGRGAQVAPTAKSSPANAVAVAAVVTNAKPIAAPKDMELLLRSAVVELDACRRLLLGEPLKTGTVSASRPRVRAARG